MLATYDSGHLVTDQEALADVLARAHVADAVFALRPDYRVALVAVAGVEPGPSDANSETLLKKAEASARQALTDCSVDQIPHVAEWRAAYRAFGAKPQRTRNSVEALLRRADSALPRINRLTDVYNALSVLHRIPIGEEDLTRYVGAPRLIRATGVEAFETATGGLDVVEHPEPGEVVWCDDAGVTCRRWNWRQTRRTALREDTTTALFILDALAPVTEARLRHAADDLSTQLTRLGTDVRIAQRLVSSPTTHGQGD